MPTYHCHAAGCRFICRTIKAMGAHQRKKHPGRLKSTQRHKRVVDGGFIRPGPTKTRSGTVDRSGTWHPFGCRCEGCR